MLTYQMYKLMHAYLRQGLQKTSTQNHTNGFNKYRYMVSVPLENFKKIQKNLFFLIVSLSEFSILRIYIVIRQLN